MKMTMNIQRITKRFSRKITSNFQSWEFSTELTIELPPGVDATEASNALFKKAKELVDNDIAYAAKSEINSINGGAS